MVYHLQNEFLYIRQKAKGLTDSLNDLNGKQFVYYLKGGNGKLVLERVLTVEERDAYASISGIVSH